MANTNDADIVYSVSASPRFEHDGTCFAAHRSGLYRSEDGGLTWKDAYQSLNLEAPLTTASVAFSPAFEQDQTVFAGVPGAVLCSTDGGRTWAVARLPSPPPFVVSLVVSPNVQRDGVVLAGTMEDGVFRSADRGSHWAAWNFGLLDLNVLCMAISPSYADDETLFVGTESGIFRSINGGRAWREVDFPADWAPVLSLAIAPYGGRDEDGQEVLFAGTESSGLLRSEDRGQTWRPMGEESIPETVNGVIVSPGPRHEPSVLAVLPEALLLSRDGGNTWSPLDAATSTGHQLTSAAAPQGLEPGAPLLAGTLAGSVLRLTVDIPR